MLPDLNRPLQAVLEREQFVQKNEFLFNATFPPLSQTTMILRFLRSKSTLFCPVQTTTRTRHSTGFPREDIEPYVTILHNDAHGRSQLAVRSRMRRGSLSGAIDSTACANLR